MADSFPASQSSSEYENPLPSLYGSYAGIASRSMALIIDALILALVITIASLLVKQLVDLASSIWILITGARISLFTNRTFQIMVSILTLILTYGIYFVFFWTFFGTTIGGFIIGIRLVDKKGKRPSFLRCLLRFIIEFMIPIFLFIGSLWILFTSRKQAWYDSIAGTYVIYNWAAKPEERHVRRGLIAGYSLPESAVKEE